MALELQLLLLGEEPSLGEFLRLALPREIGLGDGQVHRHAFFGMIRASTATAPLGPTISGLTSHSAMTSARSAASTEKRATASAAASISAGGAPREPSSTGRTASPSSSRRAVLGPNGARP